MAEANGTTSYTYDDLDRLTGVTYPHGEQVTYAYDTVGNRVAMTSTVGGTTLYSYDAANRLLTAGGAPVTWDANGNMTGLGGTTYGYDAANRLTQVVTGTTSVQYTYNGDGWRMERTQGASTTSYLWDAASPLPVVVLEVTNGITTTYLYGGNLLVQHDAAGNPAYLLTDGQGNVRLLVDSDGNVVSRYDYDPFGAVRTTSGSVSTPYRNAGHAANDEANLVYMRARWYDPRLGRFLTTDPRLPGSWNGQDWNLYVFARNNPMTYVDVNGEESIVPIIGVGTASHGIVKGFQETERLWSVGQDYINATQRMIMAEDIDEMLAWNEKRVGIWNREVTPQVYRTAFSFPGTSLSGSKPGIPMTWIELAFGKTVKAIYDQTLLHPARYAIEEAARRQYGASPLESADPTSGQMYYYVPSPASGGSASGGAAGRPSGGK
ncbi:MAG: hypothetical protein AUK03_00580 [Anaerolineae bacterium CG2_30_64_16]|nr:MAG: hypothetical protein AUK03_00580 [Anaerolineae bacterium CG2_30_64_16]